MPKPLVSQVLEIKKLLLKKILYFLLPIVSVCVCVGVGCTYGDQKRVLNLGELELQLMVSLLTWVLGAKVKCSSTLNHFSTSP